MATTDNPGEIAAHLRRIADALDTLDNVAPVRLHTSVYLQAHPFYGSEDERRAVVDQIVTALSIDTAIENEEQYRTIFNTRQRGVANISVFTSTKPATDQT